MFVASYYHRMSKSSQLSERDLIAGCARRESSAQRELYERYASLMYSVCVRYVGREVAKDVLQVGFVTVFDKIDTFKGEGSFEGWMRRIFVNASLMEVRKTDILRNSEELGDVPVFEAGARTIGAIEQLSAKELLGLISEMPPGLRSVFNLYAVDGYTHAEVGRILGISEMSSRSQLSRARVWLQEKVKKLYDR